MVLKIAVLGAGVNGLACAVKIKEKYKDCKLVLISDEFTPNTTGDGSGGLWYPYLCGKTPQQLLGKWGIETYDLLHKLWLEGGYGISLVPIYTFYENKDNWYKPTWSGGVFGFHIFDEEHLKYLNKLFSKRYTAGHMFTTFIVPPPTFLSYLTRRYSELNGEVLKATVTSLQDDLFNEFDVVINCAGLSSKWIVPDDAVIPIRGQIAKVHAPWIKECIVDEDSGNYIIPSEHHCVLGGTHQDNNFNRNVDEADTAFVLNGCKNMIPSLKDAKLLYHWVGLRPGRDEIRLEAEKKNNKLYIHNYGHGGSGLTLFWGCASEVLHLLDDHINNKSTYSKL